MAQGGGFGLCRNDALPYGKRLSAGPDRRHPGLSRSRSGHHRGRGWSGNETVFTYRLTRPKFPPDFVFRAVQPIDLQGDMLLG